ncbi:small redox-active disulfide protein 2 [Fusobacterium naviforme]|uniref:Small redox-active disulfide protein 2 n=1 Tax=Moryella indoligenes TaxID=371674 RepID=A0AAE3VA05_9FIRM|nr:thioredoxin family protein [Moryella indoligenes]KAB0577793.1 thioredoxin family protein [Fusobacterium naviforme]MDQ0152522.1 small redox-active disulfide protein 2 [Moryella indoligenes]PSL10580.1 small redox-active disulfide protein 2 [Fusobacterium naviforme]STO27129.1 redox-active disulfide protein 2 [Fusobacterium naviforme]
MGLFGLEKKKKKIKSCCSGANCTPEEMVKAEEGKRNGGIKVLGGGCAKCHELEANAVAALKELGMDDTVELITDFAVIASYGVMSTPALVLDGRVVSYGKILKTEEIKAKVMGSSMYHTFKTE